MKGMPAALSRRAMAAMNDDRSGAGGEAIHRAGNGEIGLQVRMPIVARSRAGTDTGLSPEGGEQRERVGIRPLPERLASIARLELGQRRVGSIIRT